MIGNGHAHTFPTIAGEMYIIPGDSYAPVITVAATYAVLIGFHKGKEANITVDETNGTFTIVHDGSYKFDGVASLAPSIGMTLEFAVFVNGVIAANINTLLNFQNSQDDNTFSGTGWLDLVVGDVIDVRGKSNNVPVTLNISHMNISLARRGN